MEKIRFGLEDSNATFTNGATMRCIVFRADAEKKAFWLLRLADPMILTCSIPFPFPRGPSLGLSLVLSCLPFFLHDLANLHAFSTLVLSSLHTSPSRFVLVFRTNLAFVVLPLASRVGSRLHHFSRKVSPIASGTVAGSNTASEETSTRMQGLWTTMVFVLAAMEMSGMRNGAMAASQKTKRITGRHDASIKQAKKECARRIDEEGDPTCVATLVDRENCVLKCMEPECYEQIYGQDPLEEGEVDVVRGKAFRQCQREAMMQREKQGEL